MEGSPRIDLLALSLADLDRLVDDLGWPRYRAIQIRRWVYQHRADTIEQISDLSRAHRDQLSRLAVIRRAETAEVRRSADGTCKVIVRLADQQLVESVAIPDADRLTLCLSTQVGCTLDCTFCRTAQLGLSRNLRAGELAEQVRVVLGERVSSERVTNVVLMGMGEPLANLDAVRDGIEILTNEDWGLGLSRKRVTLSTAGWASRLLDVSEWGVNVAISLNATTEEQRRRLMPRISRRYSLQSLLEACRRYPLPSGRRLTFEYVLLAGVNDHSDDAARLVRLLRGLRCKVNLIPFNEWTGSVYSRPPDEAVQRFQRVLRDAGLDVFVRKSKGADILGACGQLGEPPDGSPQLVALASIGRSHGSD
jgi:23S rRNA (adenine2503-C2)-methyltransferase